MFSTYEAKISSKSANKSSRELNPPWWFKAFSCLEFSVSFVSNLNPHKWAWCKQRAAEDRGQSPEEHRRLMSPPSGLELSLEVLMLTDCLSLLQSVTSKLFVRCTALRSLRQKQPSLRRRFQKRTSTETGNWREKLCISLLWVGLRALHSTVFIPAAAEHVRVEVVLFILLHMFDSCSFSLQT